MGQFAEKLVGGLSDGLTSGVGGLIGGAISGIGGMLGIGAKRQLRQQKELNEQAAMLNYEYGEKAAENQFRRQMEMYERSYKDQSYAAMRKQMEEAGLNVGLMYGGGGASGGGAGATSGVPMPETGGAVAGNAASQSEMMTAGTQAAMLGLQMQKQEAEIDLLRSEAEENRAGAGYQNEQAETQRRLRDLTVEKLRQEGIAQYVQNFIETTKLEYSPDGKRYLTYRNERNEVLNFEVGIGKHGFFTQELTAKMLKAAADADKSIAEGNYYNAMKAMTDEKTLHISAQILNDAAMVRIAQKNADSAALQAAAADMEARAKELEAQWKTGEKINWKTIWDCGFQVIDTCVDWKTAKMITGKIADKLNKDGGKLTRPDQKIPPIYNSDNTVVPWSTFGN